MFGFKESLNRVHICIVYGCDCNLSTSITTPHTWSAPPPELFGLLPGYWKELDKL